MVSRSLAIASAALYVAACCLSIGTSVSRPFYGWEALLYGWRFKPDLIIPWLANPLVIWSIVASMRKKPGLVAAMLAAVACLDYAWLALRGPDGDVNNLVYPGVIAWFAAILLNLVRAAFLTWSPGRARRQQADLSPHTEEAPGFAPYPRGNSLTANPQPFRITTARFAESRPSRHDSVESASGEDGSVADSND